MAITYVMATMTVKSTFSLDVETAQRLERLAAERGMSKSAVLRQAIQRLDLAPATPPLTRLEAFRKLRESLNLTPAQIDAWLAESAELRKGYGPR